MNSKMMAKVITIVLLFVSGKALANPAMSWCCQGLDITNEAPVSFDLNLADHNGQDFTYKAVTNFVYEGKPASDIDLTQEVVVCGKTDRGADRKGVQTWSLTDGQFSLYSGCENEALEIQATCNSNY